MSENKGRELEQPEPVELEGPERIYAFADRLQAGIEEEPEEKEVLETWVVFELGESRFGLPVTHVQEILRVGGISRVPHAPRPVKGVTNVRGRVVPVVDLKLLLGLAEVEIGPASRILLLTSRGRLLGMLVDGVREVSLIAPSGIRETPSDLLPGAPRVALGSVETEDGPAVLLDAENLLLLNDPERAPDEPEA